MTATTIATTSVFSNGDIQFSTQRGFIGSAAEPDYTRPLTLTRPPTSAQTRTSDGHSEVFRRRMTPLSRWTSDALRRTRSGPASQADIGEARL